MTETTPELPPIEERPLVTFALFAYNQEKYIREAVEGAFAQTYEPLEIILSDDCSTDRTFEIMEEMAAGYRGPHAIKLNRNPKNKGISPHVRFIDEMAQGEIIVHAAGDDIACPERAERLWQAFSEGPDDLLWVISNAMKVSLTREKIGLLTKHGKKIIIDRPVNPLKTGLPGINGCSAALKKVLILKFPPPCTNIIAEDIVLLRRAGLIGCVKYIPDVLLEYRIGAGVTNSSLTAAESSLRFIKAWEDELLRFHQFKEDADYINHKKKELAELAIECQLNKLELAQKILEQRKAMHGMIAIIRLKLRDSFILLKLYVLGAIEKKFTPKNSENSLLKKIRFRWRAR